MQSLGLSYEQLGGLMAAIGVAAAAYGSHGLRPSLSKRDVPAEDVDRFVKAFSVAANMAMVTGASLLALSASTTPAARVAAPMVAVGGGLFSTAVFTASLTANKAFNKPAPIGGVLLMLGYLTLTLHPFFVSK